MGNNLFDADKSDNTKRLMLSVICVLLLAVIALCIYLLAFYNKSPQNEPSSSPETESSFLPVAVTSDRPDESDTAPEESSEASQSQPASSAEPSSEPASSEPESSAEESSAAPVGELDHQWYGYVYRYLKSALEDFTPSSGSKQAYADAVNALYATIGKSSTFYHIIIPTQVEFLKSSFPPEVTSSKNDGFYNQSQSKYISFVADETVEGIKDIDVCALFTEKYDAGEYLYFNTDKNYTALGAYYAYTSFCESAGIEPVKLAELTEYTNDRFLGSFYTSTGSETLAENPDKVVFHDLDAKYPSDVTIYNGTSIYNKQKMIYKDVSSSANGYNAFFGREAYRIEISVKSPTTDRSVLVIGDLSAAPFVPYLSANYKTVTYLNATMFSDTYYVTLQEFLKDKSYDDIVVIDYSTSYKSPFFFAKNLEAMIGAAE